MKQPPTRSAFVGGSLLMGNELLGSGAGVQERARKIPIVAGVVDRLLKVKTNLASTKPASRQYIAVECQDLVIRPVMRMHDAVHATQHHRLTWSEWFHFEKLPCGILLRAQKKS
jgi:hypothetical protein